MCSNKYWFIRVLLSDDFYHTRHGECMKSSLFIHAHENEERTGKYIKLWISPNRSNEDKCRGMVTNVHFHSFHILKCNSISVLSIYKCIKNRMLIVMWTGHFNIYKNKIPSQCWMAYFKYTWDNSSPSKSHHEYIYAYIIREK